MTLKAVRIHESVLRRVASAPGGYAPIVLPPDFQVVRIDGQRVAASTYLGTAAPVLSAETEHVWNHVWKRRVAYFTTLFASLALAAAPLYLDTSLDGACRSSLCFVTPVITAIGVFLPSFASTWLDVFSRNPVWFVGLAALVSGGLFAGSLSAVRVSDAMRRAWYSLSKTRPKNLPAQIPEVPTAADGAIESLRLSPRYQDGMRALTRWVLPGGFVVLVLLGASALLLQFTVAIADTVGLTCRDGGGATGRFATSTFCAAPDGGVRERSRYRITLTVKEPWADGAPLDIVQPVKAGPNGVAPHDVSIPMILGVPWRRHVSQPWMKLLMRIGSVGSDVYALDWRRRHPIPSEFAPPGDVIYEAEFTARTGGRLYFYVNDVPLPVFYDRNRGTATVAVTLLSETR